MAYSSIGSPAAFNCIPRALFSIVLVLLSFRFVMLWTDLPAIAQAADPQAASIGFNPQALLRNALEWVNGLDPVGAIAFLAIYIFATVAFS